MQNNDEDPTTDIATHRLRLPRYKTEDRESYLRLVSDPVVMSHIDPGIPDPETAEIWWQKLVGGQTKGKKWCCERVSDHAYIGHAIINRYQAANGTNSYELGYILPQHHWGFGFATEIVRAPANFSRETMRLEQIYATVDFENTASIHVLVKTGFQLRGHAIDENGKYPVYILNH